MLAILLVVSYVAIGLFGAFGMHAQTDMHIRSTEGHGVVATNCIAVTAKGVDCPKQADPIDFVDFHFDAFRSFSSATFGVDVFASLLVLSLMFLGAGIGLSLSSFAPSQLSFARIRLGFELISPSPPKWLLRWLALHENKPRYCGAGRWYNNTSLSKSFVSWVPASL